jgi:hypothetical protein
MRRGRKRSERENATATRSPYKKVLLVFGDPKYHYRQKRKLGVLANPLEQLDMLQGLSSTNLSNRLPSYLVTF